MTIYCKISYNNLIKKVILIIFTQLLYYLKSSLFNACSLKNYNIPFETER